MVVFLAGYHLFGSDVDELFSVFVAYISKAREQQHGYMILKCSPYGCNDH